MKVISEAAFFLLICSATAFADSNEPDFDELSRVTGEILVYHGMSDASAAVAVTNNMFIVADDENNILRVYKSSGGGLPEFCFDMTDFLGIEPEHPEADIEGATMIRDRIYWITSHGRNKDGKMRPNRYRFFATKVLVENGKVSIAPVGKPCKTLIHKLVQTQMGKRLGLDKATRFDEVGFTKKKLRKLAPKEQGLNIEGLCASADGRTIYIGFRNPLVYDRVTRQSSAIALPLNNPDAVVERGEEPIFGEPMLWNLGGLGVRDMAYSHFHKAYFIIAGPADEGPGFALYRWSGEKDVPPVMVRQLNWGDFSPEALVPFRNSPRLLLLSDDGTIPVKVANSAECMKGELGADGTCPNKFLTDLNKKTFRGIWLTP
jgi:hypothetical protein